MNTVDLRNRARGMSIVELMVAVVISLIGTIVIFQVYAVNEEIRRSATAGSDEQTNGLIGLTLVERELRHAGYGLNDVDLVGCNMVTYDTERTPSSPTPYPLAPVRIISNTGATPDVVRVMYGGSSLTTIPVKLDQPMPDVHDFPVLAYTYGFNAGDMIIIGQPGADCTIREVTAVLASKPLELQTITGTYVNSKGVSKATRWNNPSGTPSTYDAKIAKVINLGDLVDDARPPRYNEMTVQTGMVNPADNNKLVLQNLWGQTASFIPVAENIVQLKAEYGMDDGVDNGTVPAHPFVANDGIVDRYTTDQPTGANWRLVKAVRVALVSRSAQTVRPTAGASACDATPDFDPAPANTTYPVRWAYGPDTPHGRPIDVRTTSDWRCFKYQVYETTVPLRNLIWSPS